MSALLEFLPSILGAVGSGVSGLFGREETPMQGKQRELLDQLLSSVRGTGPFSDLFNVDEETFQKSYVDPAKQRFTSQIAPQIQQSYIAGGQQRGTGLEDTLARAGVDLDQMLNQQYGQLQQQAQQSKLGALGYALGAPAGAQAPQTGFERFGEGVGGYLSSRAFPKTIEQVLDRRLKQREVFKKP